MAENIPNVSEIEKYKMQVLLWHIISTTVKQFYSGHLNAADNNTTKLEMKSCLLVYFSLGDITSGNSLAKNSFVRKRQREDQKLRQGHNFDAETFIIVSRKTLTTRHSINHQ